MMKKEKNPVRVVFAKRLQKVRRGRSVSQQNLARLLGVHFMSISRWERGVNSPTVEQVVFLARYFHVSADYLLGLGDEDYELYLDEFSDRDKVEEVHGKDKENED